MSHDDGGGPSRIAGPSSAAAKLALRRRIVGLAVGLAVRGGASARRARLRKMFRRRTMAAFYSAMKTTRDTNVLLVN